MLRLKGRTHFLVLKRNPDCTGHLVAFHSRFEDALATWSAGTRLSPIFATERARPPSLKGKTRCWLLFLGPVDPGRLTVAGTVFLTFGLYNVLVVSRTTKERDGAVAAAKALSVPWEEWEVVGREIKEIQHDAECGASPPRSELSVPETVRDPLIPSAREYAALIASVRARAAQAAPGLSDDLAAFDAAFRQLVKDEKDALVKRGLLVVANAALSRHSSQTFSGTTPISETECHFWTHSLLGIGVASLALHRFQRFVAATIQGAELPDRIRGLGRQSAHKDPLITLQGDDEFWDSEPCFAKAVHPPATDPVLPLLTCFSGRDGFRSTRVSLSAPLEAIESANTVSWTLLTLTHELSHTIIEAILGLVFPDLDSATALSHTAGLLLGSRASASLLEDLRVLLCFPLCTLDGNEIEANQIGQRLRDEWAECNELLTHIFDFLYFYQGDADAYVRCVWASWAVIPNIQHRLGDYITRCLCALHAENLRRKDAIEITIDSFSTCLADTAKKFPDLTFIAAAKEELKKNRSAYVTKLTDRTMLVRVVKTFLHSPSVAAKLAGDDAAGAGPHDGYDLKVNEFSGVRIRNPLRFVDAYAADRAPDAIKSLWLLHHIAFSEES